MDVFPVRITVNSSLQSFMPMVLVPSIPHCVRCLPLVYFASDPHGSFTKSIVHWPFSLAHACTAYPQGSQDEKRGSPFSL